MKTPKGDKLTRVMGTDINLANQASDPTKPILEAIATANDGHRAHTQKQLEAFNRYRERFFKDARKTFRKPARAKLPNGLTMGMESLCQNIVAGMPHGEAYRDAYQAKHLKPAAVYSRLYHVLKHPQVQARLQELWAEREAIASHTPQQLRLFVLERLMIEATNAGNTGSTRVRAVELIGKLGGVRAFEEEGKANPGSEMDKADLVQRLSALLGEAVETKAGKAVLDN